MNRYYITFGVGSIFAKYFVVVAADDEEKARRFAASMIPGWADIHEGECGTAIVEKFGLAALIEEVIEA